MNSLYVKLAEQVRRYLNGEVSAGTLDLWVIERLQVLLDSGDKQAIALANTVDGGLVQLQEGAITKAELNEELRALVDRRPIFHIAEMEIIFPGAPPPPATPHKIRWKASAQPQSKDISPQLTIGVDKSPQTVSLWPRHR